MTDFLVFIVVVGLAIGLLLSVLMLRVGCSLMGIAVPNWPNTLGIVLVSTLVALTVRVAFVGIASLATDLDPFRDRGFSALVNLLGLEIDMLVAAAIYCKWLDIGFGKALGLFWVQVLLFVLIAAACAIPVLAWMNFGNLF